MGYLSRSSNSLPGLSFRGVSLPQLLFRYDATVRSIAVHLAQTDGKVLAFRSDEFAPFCKAAACRRAFEIGRYARDRRQLDVPQALFRHDDRAHQAFGIR